MSWRVQPLSIRHKLFCEYSGSRIDPLRFSEDDLPKKTLIKIVKTQLGETKAEIEEDDLRSFCRTNPAPEVTRHTAFIFIHMHLILLSLLGTFITRTLLVLVSRIVIGGRLKVHPPLPLLRTRKKEKTRKRRRRKRNPG